MPSPRTEREIQIITVTCPSCKAEPGIPCTSLDDVPVPLHVARRRRWRIEQEEHTKNTP